MRASIALICVFTATSAFAADHVQAAKHAERRGEWHKALEEWKAAYSSDVNAEDLIGIGDAYAHLGNKAEAKKNYEAYLADPLALPANVSKVKTKIAELDGPGLGLPGEGLALPGAGPGLDLPGASAPPPLPGPEKHGRKVADAAPPPLPGLDLPGAAPAPAKKTSDTGLALPGATAKKDNTLALPGLDLPAPPPAKREPPAQVANKPSGLDLPPLPGATPPPAKKEPPAQVASRSTGLDLPPLPGDRTPAPVARKEPPPAPMVAQPARPSTPPATVAVATPPSKTLAATPHEPERVPEEAIAVNQTHPQPIENGGGSGASRVVAFVAAGVAVAALGGGAYAYTKASSAHSDLTSKVHDGATASSLLQTERQDRTLSFVGIAGGIVAGGIAAALFAF